MASITGMPAAIRRILDQRADSVRRRRAGRSLPKDAAYYDDIELESIESLMIKRLIILQSGGPVEMPGLHISSETALVVVRCQWIERSNF